MKRIRIRNACFEPLDDELQFERRATESGLRTLSKHKKIRGEFGSFHQIIFYGHHFVVLWNEESETDKDKIN